MLPLLARVARVKGAKPVKGREVTRPAASLIQRCSAIRRSLGENPVREKMIEPSLLSYRVIQRIVDVEFEPTVLVEDERASTVERNDVVGLEVGRKIHFPAFAKLVQIGRAHV